MGLHWTWSGRALAYREGCLSRWPRQSKRIVLGELQLHTYAGRAESGSGQRSVSVGIESGIPRSKEESKRAGRLVLLPLVRSSEPVVTHLWKDQGEKGQERKPVVVPPPPPFPETVSFTATRCDPFGTGTYMRDMYGPPVATSLVFFDLKGLSCAMCAQANTSPAYAM